jgi:1-pyrroline-5-carboxylate dehydrogenase
MSATPFRFTYATMFDPPEELHQGFEQALARARAGLGREYGLLIDGAEVRAPAKLEDRSPADAELVLGLFQQGEPRHAHLAVAAARQAYPAWSGTPWPRRAEILRRAAGLIRERSMDIAAAVALSVGKNRMEALGDVVETADLVDYACEQMEAQHGFVCEMNQDPLPGARPRNRSVLRPYGVWLVVSPFNYPCALSGGPVGAALLAGNTVVAKCSSDTPWGTRLMAECFLEAGLPAGALNLLTGPGSSLGQALLNHPGLAGVTFTGSHGVGMAIHRQFAQGHCVRPVILELGGKNPAIVSRRADLEAAALGVMRSAFGLQGQKCSACSRVYVEEPVYEEFAARLAELASRVSVGDPTRREVYLGPVVNRRAWEKYAVLTHELAKAGRVLCGGQTLDQGELARGWFCAPTVVADAPLNHPLWQEEMFLPVTMLAKIDDLAQAMELANDSIYGLTAGFYGSDEEAEWFFERMEAGVCYANRPMGATTGAWPGFQPFGGCKASGSSGKNAGGRHYLQLYMREQVQAQILRGA